MFHICEKFHNDISNACNLQSGHKYMIGMTMFNVQRALSLKVGKPALRFVCLACHLTVFNICLKFRENISNGIRVMERTRMIEAMRDGHSKFRRV